MNSKASNSFLFWQKWLFYTSVLFALFGVAFAVYGDNPLFRPYNQALARLFWHSSQIPAEIVPFRAFIWGPLGGTIACSYILLAYIARYPFRRKERWARNAILVAFGTWVILDSAISVYYGVYFQFYLINAFSFLIKALPLVFTWKDFRKPAG
ncbi:hypothetical protein I2I11_02715 [Pontibacter sp. 172403-2]|uniref:hypothetical protein n=1 Tax=Pontibacter rufus TaxID=2791028 RepID=UPI0018AFD16A|nr:hypothetical protein [Pontibacter sp. 172403-2]MBF9252196.1 hypothetical protein [Pontibacter sp. 172403-2]